MVWLIGGALVLYLFALWRIFPGLFVPVCPICGARLERRIDIAVLNFGKHLHLGMRRFVCPQCPYSHHRPAVYRDPVVET